MFWSWGTTSWGDMAREQLAHQGWLAQPTPRPGTPLAELRPHLSARAINILDREGFTTVEQVAVLPDTTL